MNLLMIIHNPDFFGTRISPSEHDSPLVIDPDGVVSFQITLETFQAITGRTPEILQVSGVMEHVEFSCGNRRDLAPLGLLGHLPGVKELVSTPVSKRSYRHSQV